MARFSDLGRLSVIAPSEPELSSKWCPEPRSPNTDTSAKVLSSEKTLHSRSPRGHSDRTRRGGANWGSGQCSRPMT